MLFKQILVIALVGHGLAEAVPSGPVNEPQKTMLVFATDGEGKTMGGEEKAAGFRRSIPPGGAFGSSGFGNSGFGNGAFDSGLGTGFAANTGFGFGNGLPGNSFTGNAASFGSGFVGNRFTGNAGSFGSGMMGNHFVGNSGLGIGAGLTGNSFAGTGFGSGLANNFVGNGLAGANFGVDALNPVLQGSQGPMSFRNNIAYSPFGTNVGGFGMNTGFANQPSLVTGFWPNRQGLMTNNFNGFSGTGGFNDLSSFHGLGSNGPNGFNGGLGFNNFAGAGGLGSLGSVNTFRNNAATGGVNDFGSLNGFNTATGVNNFGSLNSGINGFSSFNNRFNAPNNGLNNGFSSLFNTGGSGGFNANPTQFGLNSFGESNFFKRSPLDPTSPYYIQLHNNEDDQQTDSGWSGNRDSGRKPSNWRTNTVTTQSAGSQVRSNSDTSV